MTEEEAEALVAKGLEDPTVKALFDKVQASSPIKIAQDGEGGWGCITNAHGTTIFVDETAYPTENLYHELLHCELKVSGYRQYKMYVQASDGLPMDRLVAAIDNELQHHRFFPAFIAAGFDPSRFFHDRDEGAYDHVRKALKRLKPTSRPAAYFFLYLTVIAPGGSGTEAERERLMRFFRIVVPKHTFEAIEAAAAVLTGFGTSAEMDPGEAIVAIARHLGGYEGWWIGRSKIFPDDGLFVGEPFSMDDAARYAGVP